MEEMRIMISENLKPIFKPEPQVLRPTIFFKMYLHETIKLGVPIALRFRYHVWHLPFQVKCHIHRCTCTRPIICSLTIVQSIQTFPVVKNTVRVLFNSGLYFSIIQRWKFLLKNKGFVEACTKILKIDNRKVLNKQCCECMETSKHDYAKHMGFRLLKWPGILDLQFGLTFEYRLWDDELKQHFMRNLTITH
jgi:hypothetical protein